LAFPLFIKLKPDTNTFHGIGDRLNRGGNTATKETASTKLPYPACHNRHSRILHKKIAHDGLFAPLLSFQVSTPDHRFCCGKFRVA